MTVPIVLLLLALVCAVLVMLEASVPKVNLVGAALTCYFLSLLWPTLVNLSR